MKTNKSKLLLFFIFTLSLCIAHGALADWFPGDPNKMHWPQLPDLSQTGMDVDMFWTPLADDFKCTQTGPITDIHIWGSFADDILPAAGPGSLTFQLMILSNIPEEPPVWNPQVLADDFPCETTGYITDFHIWGSWYRDRPPYYDANAVTFILSIHEDIPAEQSSTGYSMPGALLWKKIFKPGQFTVTPEYTDLQEGWLVPCTSPPYYEFPADSICWRYDFFINQTEAFQQEGSPTFQKIYWLDVQAVPVREPGYTEPIRFGWKTSLDKFSDDAVYAVGEDPPIDVWKELRYPIDHPYSEESIDLAFAITTDFTEKYSQKPDLADTGIDVDATREDNYSLPAEILWYGLFYPGDYTVRDVPTDIREDWYDPVTGLWLDDNHQLVFQYNFKIEDYPLTQEEGTIYWLAVKDIPPADPDYTFGWKTTTLDLRFADDAIYQTDFGWLAPLKYPEGHEYQGQTLDLAFVINGGPVEPDLDFGDVPDPTYPTWLASDGARHIIVPNVFLGALIDAEPDGQPNASATGDDINGLADEDGVIFTGSLMPGTLQTVLISPSVNGFINAWIDFNGDGDWDDAGERIFTDYFVSGALINNCPFMVPFGATPNISTFARFRFTTFASLPPLAYTGLAADGEVEDYMVDIEENPAIKWIQLPDGTPNGIDIRVDDMRWIADDFTCTRYGLITDIHLWTSWREDLKGQIRSIKIQFCSDDPVGWGGTDPDNQFSKPDKVLWEKEFFPDDFNEVWVKNVPEGEYWWDPFYGEWLDPGDKNIWRIDILIPENQAFPQKGSPHEPVIYWLCVKADTELGELGWKTRRYPEQHEDDAVFYRGSELPREWRELRYPSVHPYSPNSIDMAFVLTGIDTKQPVTRLKWSQPPIEINPLLEFPIYCGWDEESWTQDPINPFPQYSVADDFRCIGNMPVSSVHFWGSNKYWTAPEPPPIQPTSWEFKFYSNIAAGNSCDFLYGAATGQSSGNLPSSLYRIDPTDGSSLLIGLIGYNGVTGLSFGPDGKLYASANGDNLYTDGFKHAILLTIDTSTGAGTLIGEISNNGQANGAGRMPDISFSSDGILYGYADFGPGGDALWTIDTTTGAGTFIGYTGFGWGGNGLDFAPDGTLYATPEDKNCLVIIDKSTGAGSCAPGTEPNVPSRINALDFCRQNGILYGSWKDSTQISYLVTLDLQTGQPTVIGQTILGLDAITFGPEFSRPGKMLWEVTVPNERVNTEWVGYDEYPEITTESCFQHTVYFNSEEYFWQNRYIDDTNDNIYWLGIRAIYPTGIDVEFPWGWKTRPESWMDDAVKYDCRVVGWEIDPGSGELIPVIECRFWPIKDPLWGESFDTAFELDTDPRWIKYEQPYTGIRDWPHYEDKLSMATEDDSGAINIIQKVADDWPCRRRTPVTALAWYGSYLEYLYQTPCTEPPGIPPVPPEYFLITIHRDIPADDPDNNYGFSIPGKKIWEYRAYDYDEVLIGYDKHPEGTEAPREPVYRYSVKLPHDEWFRQRNLNGIYWISIMAVYGPNQKLNHLGWGWTIHEHIFMDDAVAGRWDIGPAPMWIWEEILDQNEESADMSFTLFTDPDDCVDCPDYNWSGLVEFKDWAVFALDWLWQGPAGGYANGDLNCNGKVNFEDVEIFTGLWLQSCP